MIDGSRGAQQARQVRVVIVERSAHARKLVRGALHSDPAIEVIGWSAGGKHAVAAVAELRPDVVTLDVGLLRAGLLTSDEFGVLRELAPIVVVTAGARLAVDPAEEFLTGAAAVARRPSSIDIFDPSGTTAALVAAVREAAGTRRLSITLG